jgi:hypothetical protein
MACFMDYLTGVQWLWIATVILTMTTKYQDTRDLS